MRWLERDPWLELAQVFLRNPFRTFLSSLGVGWGLFMILITVGASNGLEEGVKQDMGNRVKNSAFMWGRSTTIPYKGYPRGRSIELNSADVAYLEENASTLLAVAPRRLAPVNIAASVVDVAASIDFVPDCTPHRLASECMLNQTILK